MVEQKCVQLDKGSGRLLGVKRSLLELQEDKTSSLHRAEFHFFRTDKPRKQQSLRLQHKEGYLLDLSKWVMLAGNGESVDPASLQSIILKDGCSSGIDGIMV